jgi:hypothetical protein
MTDLSDGKRTAEPLLPHDSMADKAVRFGCGAVLAALVVTGLALSGLGEPLSVPVVATAGILVVLVSGGLSIAFGERYLVRLLKLINWL